MSSEVFRGLFVLCAEELEQKGYHYDDPQYKQVGKLHAQRVL